MFVVKDILPVSDGIDYRMKYMLAQISLSAMRYDRIKFGRPVREQSEKDEKQGEKYNELDVQNEKEVAQNDEKWNLYIFVRQKYKMGAKVRKPCKKRNNDIDDQKLLKTGIGFGRGDICGK